MDFSQRLPMRLAAVAAALLSSTAVQAQALVNSAPSTTQINQAFDSFTNQSSLTVGVNGYAVVTGNSADLDLALGSSITNTVGGGVSVGGATSIFHAGTMVVGAPGSASVAHGIRAGGYVTTFENSGSITNSSATAANPPFNMAMYGDGVSIENGVGSFTNSGSVSSAGIGVHLSGTVTQFLNSGSISGGREGVKANDALNAFRNTGTISSTGTYGFYAGRVVPDFYNSGTISSTSGSASGVIFNTGVTSFLNDVGGTISGTAWGLYVFDGTSGTIENRGAISGGSIGLRIRDGSVTNIINSGTIRSNGIAVLFERASSNNAYTLTLKTGSNIEGRIDFRGGNTGDTLDFSGFAGSAELQTSGLDIIVAGSRNYVASANNSTITIIDTAAVDAPAIGQTTTAMSGAIVGVAAAAIRDSMRGGMPGIVAVPQPEPDATEGVLSALDVTAPRSYVWADGFAGGSRAPDLASIYGGIVAGAHTPVGGGVQLGVLGGYARALGAAAGDQSLTTDGGFAGVYGFAEMGLVDLSFSLLGGVNAHQSSRQVSTAGGMETASASYASWYVAPNLGIDIPLLSGGGVTLVATADAGYVGGLVNGYSETGATSSLTLGAQTISAFDGRLGLETRIEGGTSFQIAAGIFVAANMGNANVPMTVNGTASTLATTGSTQYGVYAGAGFDTALAEDWTLKSSIDGTLGVDGSMAATARAGLRGAL